jgi:hypothetical protein
LPGPRLRFGLVWAGAKFTLGDGRWEHGFVKELFRLDKTQDGCVLGSQSESHCRLSVQPRFDSFGQTKVGDER